jgi:hypothetical protein
MLLIGNQITRQERVRREDLIAMTFGMALREKDRTGWSEHKLSPSFHQESAFPLLLRMIPGGIMLT